MIPLLVSNGSVLVFELDHVKALRSAGIVGVLVGSLPKAPQQNVFLGLPLQLSIYEALWLVHARLAVLVDARKYNELISGNSPIPAIVPLLDTLLYAVTLDTNKMAPTQDILTCVVPPDLLIDHAPEDDFWARYAAFKCLREQGYFLMPGLRFGGVFVAYPGDPLKYHSHLIVKVLRQNEKVNLLSLVASGRLATAVKKAWLLVAEKDANTRLLDTELPVTAFSIEWAGFG